MAPEAIQESRGKEVTDVDVLIQGYSNYLLALQMSAATIKGYTGDVRAWADWWKKPVEFFGVDEWDDWTFYETERGLKGKSVRRHQTAVKRFFKYLRRKKLVSHDPALNAETVKVAKNLPVWLEESQVKALRRRACSHRSRAILGVLYECGLRNSEARHLRLEDVTEQWVSVRAGKGCKDRIVPMTPEVWRLVQVWMGKRTQGNEWLFPTISGLPVTERQVQRMVSQLAKTVGIKARVTPHTLRHSIATHLYNRGRQLLDIQSFLGHDDIKTTQQYVHLAKDRMRENILAGHPSIMG